MYKTEKRNKFYIVRLTVHAYHIAAGGLPCIEVCEGEKLTVSTYASNEHEAQQMFLSVREVLENEQHR